MYLTCEIVHGTALQKSFIYLAAHYSYPNLHLSFYYLCPTGTIPDAIANLQSLSEMDLSGNQLSGSLPDSIGELKALTKLSLQQNDFSGTHVCCRLVFIALAS